ncbi:peptidoglycan DD-metalloendopeptidase family protein [Heyndrickxia sporothermodurans]|uniref:peptidoglycan DD-metalloendopeptidase family protein n=1 Tax=Heyndrickxia sporothermodurans TaxID=46224 RepID=UPI002DBB240C|nr:peptidoglycan DD-metalloendopeptidase family protein [Heyndrickxia sporothermodurans]MEB6550209.1 peptidoglycan DD-metalloendopeptidase family protein [Heyndrickxia sporothermodurans]
MNEQIKKSALSIALRLALKNPMILCGAIGIIFILLITLSVFTISDTDNQTNIAQDSPYYVNCKQGKIDTKKFKKAFSNAGVFTGMDETFIFYGTKHKIDPVLLAAIALLETGRGTSQAVVRDHNPGGLTGTGGSFVFASLEEGIDAMAKNLYKLYISQGLVTIPDIGNKYSPIGADNDPNNTNQNWIPSVTSIANELGGLSMNCTKANAGSGDFLYPIPNAPITSSFGYRIDPITGAAGEFHKGTDFGCSVGTPIQASASGQVAIAVHDGWGGGYGHHVVLKHGDKYTLYGHMTKVKVNVGGSVKQGDIIGTCGQTGSATGPHVHFEIQLSLYGTREDPMKYLGGKK